MGYNWVNMWLTGDKIWDCGIGVVDLGNVCAAAAQVAAAAATRAAAAIAATRDVAATRAVAGATRAAAGSAAATCLPPSSWSDL